MKRLKDALIFLLTILSLSPLFAGREEAFSATYSIGNDSLTHGLSRNYDDFKTFGLYMDYEFDDYNIFLDLDAYTFKEENYRYDLLSIGAYRTFVFDDFYFIQAGLGLQTKGKLGAQSMQNYLHWLTGIIEVHIPYETDEYSFAPRLSIEGFLDTTVSPYIYAKTGFDAFIKGGVKFKSGESSALYLTYSYDAFGDHGINFRMDSDYGLIYSTYETNLLNHRGFGTMGINPFKKLHGNKTAVSGSVWVTDLKKYDELELRFPIEEKLSAFINIKFMTGVVNENDESVRKEDNLYGLGLGYTLWDRVELRALGGMRYYEERENSQVDYYVKGLFEASARVRAFEVFNVYVNAEAGVLWERGFHFFAGYSITI